jgi:hypothetical protein
MDLPYPAGEGDVSAILAFIGPVAGLIVATTEIPPAGTVTLGSEVTASEVKAGVITPPVEEHRRRTGCDYSNIFYVQFCKGPRAFHLRNLGGVILVVLRMASSM